MSFIAHKKLGHYRFTMLQLLSPNKYFFIQFQSSLIIFHHKLLTREGKVLANGRTHPWSMTIFVHLFKNKRHPKSYHSDIKYHMALNTMFSVATSHLLNSGPLFTSSYRLNPLALKTDLQNLQWVTGIHNLNIL